MSCRPLFLVLFVLLIYIFKFSLFGSRPLHTLHRQGPGALHTLLKDPVPSRSLHLLLNQGKHEQLFAQLFVLLTDVDKLCVKVLLLQGIHEQLFLHLFVLLTDVEKGVKVLVLHIEMV